MIVITKFPTRFLNGNTALLSKWSCVHHPILFEACRQDVKVQSVQNVLGVWWILLYGPAPTELQVGQTIRLVSGLTDTEVEVLAITSSQITITNPGAASTGGYFNLTTGRRNYVVEIDVLAVNESNQYYSVGILESKTAPNGQFKFNPSGFLRDAAELRGNTYQYDQLNKKIVGAGSRFNFRYRESWVGSTNSWSRPSTSAVFYWVNSTKQLQEAYGFNVADWVTFPTVQTTKFLTSFERPTYFPGFPFALSFIWSDKIHGRAVSKEEEGFDLNGNSIHTASFDLDGSQSLAVNRLLVNVADPDITFLEVWLNDNGVEGIDYVHSGWVAAGYHESPTKLPAISSSLLSQ